MVMVRASGRKRSRAQRKPPTVHVVEVPTYWILSCEWAQSAHTRTLSMGRRPIPCSTFTFGNLPCTILTFGSYSRYAHCVQSSPILYFKIERTSLRMTHTRLLSNSRRCLVLVRRLWNLFVMTFLDFGRILELSAQP